MQMRLYVLVQFYLKNGSIKEKTDAISLFTIQIKLSHELRAIRPEVDSSAMAVILVEGAFIALHTNTEFWTFFTISSYM